MKAYVQDYLLHSSISIRLRRDEEIRAASIHVVRKLSGFTRPSKANGAAFDRAVDDVAAVARSLIDSLVTTATPRDRVRNGLHARRRRAAEAL